MNALFFELLRVATGHQKTLSTCPSQEEWRELFTLANKQALLGVCFAGVKMLKEKEQELPADLYMKWLALAARIQQRNEVMNRRCVEAQQLLAEVGLKASILKGQGVACLYPEHLRLLRQSGDIDVWVSCGMEKALALARQRYGEVEYDYVNAHLPMFKDVEVELHWRAQSLANLFRNRTLQRWLEREETKDQLLGGKAELPNRVGLITVPTAEFNSLYLLLHAYRHFFESGLGLRQVMDYYFLLCHLGPRNELDCMKRTLGLERFDRALRWVMWHVFEGEDVHSFLADSQKDERDGHFVLEEMMRNGNFGHHDSRIKQMSKDGRWQSIFTNLQHSWLIARKYPSEALWMPIWIVWHFIWKRTKKI